MHKMKEINRQTNIPINLESAIKSIARERGLRVEFDTHYDAMNCVVSWIKGKILYRLDFQPTTSGGTDVTLYKDHFLLLPRLLSWADSRIPFFAYLSPLYRKIDYKSLMELSNGESLDYYNKVVQKSIDEIA